LYSFLFDEIILAKEPMILKIGVIFK
jgi:hypothetical protein